MTVRKNPVKIKDWDDCTHAEKLARWVNVERVLKAMTPHERREHWNMGIWGVKTPCGTVCCAAGQCGTDAWFIKRGFELNPAILTQTEIDNGYDLDDVDFPTYGFKNSVVVEDFFGVDGAYSIFNNGTQRSVSQVIKEVQHYIRFLKVYPTLLKQFKVDFKKEYKRAPDEIEIELEMQYNTIELEMQYSTHER